MTETNHQVFCGPKGGDVSHHEQHQNQTERRGYSCGFPVLTRLLFVSSDQIYVAHNHYYAILLSVRADQQGFV